MDPCVLHVKTDLEKIVIISNIEKRDWVVTDEDDWNIYWANKRSARNIFRADSSFRLGDHQLINHFPNHHEITRKDFLIRNLKRYHRELAREGLLQTVGDILDYVPCTFNIPIDLPLFFDEYRKRPRSTWIVKPGALSQGQGIFLVNRLSQARRWANSRTWLLPNGQHESYVLSRYIDNPLLIGNRKFDLRLYVLVVCYAPLRAYIYNEGFGRFTTVDYSSDPKDLRNLSMHLTNVAIQKGTEGYSKRNGGKWPLSSLKLYLSSTRGVDATNRLFLEMEFIVIQTLKAAQRVISNDRHCFECYGFDLLIDDNLHPWLIEVNGSPSLSSTTCADRQMKSALINDIFNILCTPRFLSLSRQSHGQHVPQSFYHLDPPQNIGKTERPLDSITVVAPSSLFQNETQQHSPERSKLLPRPLNRVFFPEISHLLATNLHIFSPYLSKKLNQRKSHKHRDINHHFKDKVRKSKRHDRKNQLITLRKKNKAIIPQATTSHDPTMPVSEFEEISKYLDLYRAVGCDIDNDSSVTHVQSTVTTTPKKQGLLKTLLEESPFRDTQPKPTFQPLAPVPQLGDGGIKRKLHEMEDYDYYEIDIEATKQFCFESDTEYHPIDSPEIDSFNASLQPSQHHLWMHIFENTLQPQDRRREAFESYEREMMEERELAMNDDIDLIGAFAYSDCYFDSEDSTLSDNDDPEAARQKRERHRIIRGKREKKRRMLALHRNEDGVLSEDTSDSNGEDDRRNDYPSEYSLSEEEEVDESDFFDLLDGLRIDPSEKSEEDGDFEEDYDDES
ncbi:putative Tubulin glycylase 3B [Blattamonas nauphoetae]|uniref:Tubulin glycylase 3B n=1 Tax=Blattamonas nauphoetae TaxID=2049346 RepID=A0ABQ9YHS9_9EUKA|nr:putative Tubulin glycylase 3B [Blattamonas nauphoetae]